MEERIKRMQLVDRLTQDHGSVCNMSQAVMLSPSVDRTLEMINDDWENQEVHVVVTGSMHLVGCFLSQIDR